MSDKPWWERTDDEVHAYLLNWWGPAERWRIYGYVDSGGQTYEVMDDDDDRSERVLAYLKKIGAPEA